MAKTTGFVIIAVSLAIAGAIGVVLVNGLADDTKDEASRITGVPASDGGSLRLQGASWPTAAVHVLIETPTGSTLVDAAALRSLVGPSWDDGEALCVAGPGCLVPAGVVEVSVRTPDGASFQGLFEGPPEPLPAKPLPGGLPLP